MKRILTIGLILFTGFMLFASGQQDGEADATSHATNSVVAEDGSNIAEALGPDGGWIVIFTSDVTVGKALVISGEVTEPDGDGSPRRKLALYAQDSDRNVTARYTLTTPKLTVKHVNTRIQNGTVKGDVYVEAADFNLRGATIDGNLYFSSEAVKESFSMDDASKVTGEIAVK